MITVNIIFVKAPMVDSSSNNKWFTTFDHPSSENLKRPQASENANRDLSIHPYPKLKIMKKSNKIFYKLYASIKSHNGPIERILVDYSVNKTFAISGGVDGLVKIFDIDNQVLFQTLYAHKASVVDICLHPNGKYIASVDTSGILVLHKLDSISKYFMLDMFFEINEEIMFCEFSKAQGHNENIMSTIYTIPTENDGDYDLIVLTVNGILIHIDIINKIIIGKNTCLANNYIKAICITDGGRYVFCGGDWPYLLGFDITHDDTILYFEDFSTKIKTNFISITNITAAKNTFKVAASCMNIVYIYTSLNHRIKKYSIDISEYKTITSNTTVLVHRMSFLVSNVLLILGTDKILRVYENDMLITIKNNVELGAFYTHGSKDVFVIADEEKLRFYEYSNQQIIELCTIKTPVSVNDCAFSNNGEYFITTDDTGSIHTYKLNYMQKDIYNTIQYFHYDLKSSNTEDYAKLVDFLFKINNNSKNDIQSLFWSIYGFHNEFFQYMYTKKLNINDINIDTIKLLVIDFLYLNSTYPFCEIKYAPKAKCQNYAWMSENAISRYLNKLRITSSSISKMDYMYENDIAESSNSINTQTVSDNEAIPEASLNIQWPSKSARCIIDSDSDDVVNTMATNSSQKHNISRKIMLRRQQAISEKFNSTEEHKILTRRQQTRLISKLESNSTDNSNSTLAEISISTENSLILSDSHEK